jgi:hypothetical protein
MLSRWFWKVLFGVLHSKFKKPKLDDKMAGAHSLANHALRAAIANGNLMPHAFPILRTGGNTRSLPSLVLVHPQEQRFAVLYCVHAKAYQELFRAPWRQQLKLLRNNFLHFCRGVVIFHLSEDGSPTLEEWSLSVRATREVLRAFGVPLTLSERDALQALLGKEAKESPT